MFSVCNITFQIMSYVQVYVFCLQYHIPNNVVCASLRFLFAISHSNNCRMCNFMFSVGNMTFQVCASFCFVFAISHSKYSHMCKIIFSVCNITFQIMSYVQVYVFCLQYHIPNNVVCESLCSVFAISHLCSVFAISHPNNVVYASLCFLFAISHHK